jgi:hypothetical protein
MISSRRHGRKVRNRNRKTSASASVFVLPAIRENNSAHLPPLLRELMLRRNIAAAEAMRSNAALDAAAAVAKMDVFLSRKLTDYYNDLYDDESLSALKKRKAHAGEGTKTKHNKQAKKQKQTQTQTKRTKTAAASKQPGIPKRRKRASMAYAMGTVISSID